MTTVAKVIRLLVGERVDDTLSASRSQTVDIEEGLTASM